DYYCQVYDSTGVLF
nr:immunoglobulin light chain junction region [Macaca mulatta]MOV72096.1 immunoglobulin light chain junction region [Macaca mulatta]MOV72104.1 immunoglobulin light chain junction region [Macaca mulatta]MOV72107.1 immunoglobulin light chain junction region [Macaca mulatta]MOV72124.1 immunoglobulin light chain junction region [Macaca mulatta]